MRGTKFEQCITIFKCINDYFLCVSVAFGCATVHASQCSMLSHQIRGKYLGYLHAAKTLAPEMHRDYLSQFLEQTRAVAVVARAFVSQAQLCSVTQPIELVWSEVRTVCDLYCSLALQCVHELADVFHEVAEAVKLSHIAMRMFGYSDSTHHPLPAPTDSGLLVCDLTRQCLFGLVAVHCSQLDFCSSTSSPSLSSAPLPQIPPLSVSFLVAERLLDLARASAANGPSAPLLLGATRTAPVPVPAEPVLVSEVLALQTYMQVLRLAAVYRQGDIGTTAEPQKQLEELKVAVANVTQHVHAQLRPQLPASSQPGSVFSAKFSLSWLHPSLLSSLSSLFRAAASRVSGETRDSVEQVDASLLALQAFARELPRDESLRVFGVAVQFEIEANRVLNALSQVPLAGRWAVGVCVCSEGRGDLKSAVVFCRPPC